MPGTFRDAPRRTRIVCLPRLPELREAMAGPGIGPGELAKRLGRNRSDVNGVVLGHRISNSLAQDIARYFERPVEELFFILDLEDPELGIRSDCNQALAARG